MIFHFLFSASPTVSACVYAAAQSLSLSWMCMCVKSLKCSWMKVEWIEWIKRLSQCLSGFYFVLWQTPHSGFPLSLSLSLFTRMTLKSLHIVTTDGWCWIVASPTLSVRFLSLSRSLSLSLSFYSSHTWTHMNTAAATGKTGENIHIPILIHCLYCDSLSLVISDMSFFSFSSSFSLHALCLTVLNVPVADGCPATQRGLTLIWW